MSGASSIEAILAAELRSGPLVLGQVEIRVDADGRFELRHREDWTRDAGDLQLHETWTDARSLAWYDQKGEYRPLRGAADLQHGWRLVVDSVSELRLALDTIYPAAVGMWQAYLERRLRLTSFRETLGRQTGMYRFARTISDAGASSVIENRCQATCLRTRLWSLDGVDGQPERWSTGQGDLPFFCPEACNMLVADARKVAKAEAEQKKTS